MIGFPWGSIIPMKRGTFSRSDSFHCFSRLYRIKVIYWDLDKESRADMGRSDLCLLSFANNFEECRIFSGTVILILLR